jgi:hypothetical protein
MDKRRLVKFWKDSDRDSGSWGLDGRNLLLAMVCMMSSNPDAPQPKDAIMLAVETARSRVHERQHHQIRKTYTSCPDLDPELHSSPK